MGDGDGEVDERGVGEGEGEVEGANKLWFGVGLNTEGVDWKTDKGVFGQLAAPCIGGVDVPAGEPVFCAEASCPAGLYSDSGSRTFDSAEEEEEDEEDSASVFDSSDEVAAEAGSVTASVCLSEAPFASVC